MNGLSVCRLSLAVLLAGAGCALEGDERGADLDDDVGRSQYAVLSSLQPGYSTTSNVHALANRCAEDPIGDIASGLITDPNYIMAYRSGKHSDYESCEGTIACSGGGGGGGSVAAHYYREWQESDDYHRQSIQRIHRNSTNYLLVSHSVEPYTETCWYPGFDVVEIGGAGHSTGFGNLGSGGVTPTSPALCGDHIVKYQEYSSPVRRHGGGMQVNGDYAVVAFEDPNHAVDASFRTFDLSDPPNSFSGPTVFRQSGTDKTQGSSAALTRINDGRFMVMVFGDDAADVEVFVSAGTTMPAPTAPTDWDSKGSFDFFGSDLHDFANVQFVTECDDGDANTSGRLFVVATYRDNSDQDWVHLYRVKFNALPTYAPTFEYVKSREMTCSSANTGGTRYCDFDAGAGVFVDGNGRLILYGVEHWNDHHDVSPLSPYYDHAVKVREFSTH